MDGLVGAELLGVFRVGNLDKPLAVEEFCVHRRSSFLRPLAAIGGELLVPHLQRHLLPGLECGDVETANPWNHPVPRLIQGGKHRRVQQTVSVPIQAVGVLDRFFDARPKALEHPVVRVGLMGAQDRQDHATMTIDGTVAPIFTAIRHRAVGLEAEAIPHPLDHILFQLGERPRMRLGVMPDVVGVPPATADSLVGVEPAVGKAVTGGRGQGTQWNEGPLQEPVRQSGVIPRGVPQPGHLIQALKIGGDTGDRLGRIFKPFAVPVPLLGSLHGFNGVGEMPRDDKRSRTGRLGRKTQGLGHSTDQWLSRRGGGGRRASRAKNRLLWGGG